MPKKDSWKIVLAEQQAEFLRHARDKLGEVDRLLGLLQRSPWEIANVQQISRLFHQLAGSGGFFNLPDFGAAASKAEGMAIKIAKKHSDINHDDLLKLRESCTNLYGLLDSSPASEDSTVDQVESLQEIDKTDVLLVSGDPRALLKISKFLEDFNCNVRSYRSQPAAEKALEKKPADALIIHVPLAEGSGYEVSQNFRMRIGAHRAPVIMLSGEGGFLNKVEAIRAGVDHFFEAPFDIKQVCERMRYLLDRDKPEMYRILSVEDDPYQAGIIKETLESAGYNVLSITDATQFEDSLLAFCPDLLLLDIELGMMSGYDLARYVRQNDRFAALPVIFLTTHNQLEAHMESARAGGDDHIVKPVSPQFIIARIASRLERYRTLRKLTIMDGLTQCMTFSAFMDTASKQIERSRGVANPVMMVFDIDDVAAVNAKFGFAQGDRLIQALARVVQNSLRYTEMICRTSGDEITVLLENFDDNEITQLGTHILFDFQSTDLFCAGERFAATASAGVAAIADERDKDANRLLEDGLAAARAALQTAKNNGKNRLVKAQPRQLSKPAGRDDASTGAP